MEKTDAAIAEESDRLAEEEHARRDAEMRATDAAAAVAENKLAVSKQP